MSRSLPLDLSYLLSDYMLLEADFPVLIFTMDGQVIRCNQFAEELLGETIIKQGVKGIFIDFLKTANIEEWAAADQPELRSLNTANGMPESFRFCFHKSDGYILAIGSRDTHNIKQLEQTTIELCQDLSNATRELHRKNAELKKLNDLKNQFLGMAAHDIRAPTGNIMSLGSMLLEDLSGKLEPEHIQFLEMIVDQSTFMLGMLEDLLDITAIDSGKLTLHLETGNLSEVIEGAIALHKRHAASKNISISWAGASSPLLLLMDKRKILQCVSNLISNAVKYSPLNSSVHIAVNITANAFNIQVMDQGPGLSKEDCHKLFQPFKRLNSVPTAGESSTGLGLAIVQKIVSAHHGKTAVKSELGHGSCFSIELPRNIPVETAERKTPS